VYSCTHSHRIAPHPTHDPTLVPSKKVTNKASNKPLVRSARESLMGARAVLMGAAVLSAATTIA